MKVTTMRRVGNSDVITIDKMTQLKANLEPGDLLKVDSTERGKIVIELVAFIRESGEVSAEGGEDA